MRVQSLHCHWDFPPFWEHWPLWTLRTATPQICLYRTNLGTTQLLVWRLQKTKAPKESTLDFSGGFWRGRGVSGAPAPAPSLSWHPVAWGKGILPHLCCGLTSLLFSAVFPPFPVGIQTDKSGLFFSSSASDLSVPADIHTYREGAWCRANTVPSIEGILVAVICFHEFHVVITMLYM